MPSDASEDIGFGANVADFFMRVFSNQELDQLGRPTVDVIAEKLERGDWAGSTYLVERFLTELMTMLYSYSGWEKSILTYFAELDETPSDAVRLDAIQDYVTAPERAIDKKNSVERWRIDVEQIKVLIESTQGAEAELTCRRLREDALQVHDGMMSRVTALLTLMYNEYGDDQLAEVLRRSMKPEAMDPDGTLPFREKIEKIIHFNRAHFQAFTLLEDDEKVTFIPDPCGSGARLIREGHYQSPRSGAMVRGPSPLTYGRDDLPVYCCHEPAMEMSSVLRTGVPIFIVDPPKDVGITPCKIYVYKDPANIPVSYFQRIGLERPTDLIAVSD